MSRRPGYQIVTRTMLLPDHCHVIFYLTLERLGWLWIWDGDLEAWTNWEEVPGFSSYHCDCRDTQIHLNWLAKWRFWPVYATLIGLRAAIDSQGLAGGGEMAKRLIFWGWRSFPVEWGPRIQHGCFKERPCWRLWLSWCWKCGDHWSCLIISCVQICLIIKIRRRRYQNQTSDRALNYCCVVINRR